MKKMFGSRGVNLGMWLAQYPRYDESYFDTFITKADFERIRAWGFDHVRLPIDYRLFENDDRPGSFLESGLARIDRAIEWAKATDLNLVLDLHHAPGYIFDQFQDAKLFDSSVLQERFLTIWTMFAKRYASYGDFLVFELLNEVVEPDSTRWNALAHRAIAAIRTYDVSRPIVYGGNCYSSAAELANIATVSDPLVYYTFHFYEPLLFTHQYAWWNDFTKSFNSEVRYPGKAEGLGDFVRANPKFAPDSKPYFENDALKLQNRSVLESLMTPVMKFVEDGTKGVFCGEFGVYHKAKDEDAIRWVEDMVAVMKRRDIPWTYWNYKSDDFGIVDDAGNERISGLISALFS